RPPVCPLGSIPFCPFALCVRPLCVMNWYVAEAVFQSSIEKAGADYIPLIERSWFLVSAPNEANAHEKATTLAKGRRESYANADGEQVSWILLRVERVREVMDIELKDGTEIWCEIERESQA